MLNKEYQAIQYNCHQKIICYLSISAKILQNLSVYECLLVSKYNIIW